MKKYVVLVEDLGKHLDYDDESQEYVWVGERYHTTYQLCKEPKFNVRMNGDIEHEFLNVWFERLDNAVKEFEAVQNRFNQNMAEIYLEDLAKKKRDREFMSINSFLMTRRDYIFTGSQMKKLLMLLGLTEKAAKNKAYNFKKHHNIEYFEREDLEVIVADIKEKMNEYFSK